MIDAKDLNIEQHCDVRHGMIVGLPRYTVTITHIPTGLSASADSGRTGYENRMAALK